MGDKDPVGELPERPPITPTAFDPRARAFRADAPRVLVHARRRVSDTAVFPAITMGIHIATALEQRSEQRDLVCRRARGCHDPCFGMRGFGDDAIGARRQRFRIALMRGRIRRRRRDPFLLRQKEQRAVGIVFAKNDRLGVIIHMMGHREKPQRSPVTDYRVGNPWGASSIAALALSAAFCEHSPMVAHGRTGAAAFSADASCREVARSSIAETSRWQVPQKYVVRPRRQKPTASFPFLYDSRFRTPRNRQ